MSDDRKFMEAAVAAARSSPDDGHSPRVGAVATKGSEILGTAWRSKVELGQHAEYTLLELVLKPKGVPLTGTTVYTTLEPCTKRGCTRHGEQKIPCVDRLISSKVARVVVGMIDPNPFVSGVGWRRLREANITVDVFNDDLLTQLEELNQGFTRAVKADAINRAVQEIADLAGSSDVKSARAREAVARALKQCATVLQLGQIHIPGKEMGYFKRLLDCAEWSPNPESIKAYIRLSAFAPADLSRLSWFETFYQRLGDAVQRGKLQIEYIFLICGADPTGGTKEFIDRYKAFAKKISTLDQDTTWISTDLLRPSIVLLEGQRIVFTHDRRDDASLIEATEWILPADYVRLEGQLKTIELASREYFSKDGTSKPSSAALSSMSTEPKVERVHPEPA